MPTPPFLPPLPRLILLQNVLREKGLEAISVEELVKEITPRGRATVPDSLKAELLQRIRKFLAENWFENNPYGNPQIFGRALAHMRRLPCLCLQNLNAFSPAPRFSSLLGAFVTQESGRACAARRSAVPIRALTCTLTAITRLFT
jgi:hypothetical protein